MITRKLIHGDAFVECDKLADESVDFIFTDPVYDDPYAYLWLGEMASRVLKPNSALMAFVNAGNLPHALNGLAENLIYRWDCILYYIAARSYGSVGYQKHAHCLVFQKGQAKRRFLMFDVKHQVTGNSILPDPKMHKWNKPPDWILYYMLGWTDEGSVVLDPFAGGCVVGAVAKMSNRGYICIEEDEDEINRARKYIAGVQVPMDGMFDASSFINKNDVGGQPELGGITW